MGFLRRRQIEEFDDNEWSDIDSLLKDEKETLGGRRKRAAKKATAKVKQKAEESEVKQKEVKQARQEKKKLETEAEMAREVAELEAEEPEMLVESEPQAVVQRKLIAAFLYGPGVFDKTDVVLKENDEELVLSGMRDGRITEAAARDLLFSIKDPIKKYGEDGVDRRLGYAEKERRILSYMTGRGFNGWKQTDGVTIREFSKKFPLPMDFEAAGNGFLKVIRGHSSEKGFYEYVKAMRNFKEQIYGLRRLYAREIANLQRRSAEQVTTEAGLIEVGQAEARNMMNSTIVRGEMWVDGAIERRLTTQVLLRNGLIPRWKLYFDGKEIALSGAFKVGTRDVVIGYVRISDGDASETAAGMVVGGKPSARMVARTYYRNGPTGVWRYLADYVVKDFSGKKSEIWPGVGYAEEMFRLPAELQAKLSEVAEKGMVEFSADEPEFLFAGTAKKYSSVEEYLKLRRKNELVGEVYTEVASRPLVALSGTSRMRLNPEKLTISEISQKPDFRRKLDEWQISTTLYGRLVVECFPSVDGSLKYIFAEDRRNRAFLIGVDAAESEVTSTGLRANWIFAGDLATPLYVAKNMADGFGDETETKGQYIGMWKNYVSKIKLIREYQRSKLDRKKVV